jgi:hypothetical protein
MICTSTFSKIDKRALALHACITEAALICEYFGSH